ncbi:hypothetical protein FRX31_007061 [Thalictrum thalictroides]|uniref:Transmembrane protein n=1 Tax=Thalictrum thalictroides TaxID=46969 RepID=A0A7J6X390_THATH|nr:hypothetical protein FRX31_007061 [Thalictrum thalictroides]
MESKSKVNPIATFLILCLVLSPSLFLCVAARPKLMPPPPIRFCPACVCCGPPKVAGGCCGCNCGSVDEYQTTSPP